MECTINTFADDNKLGGIRDTLENRTRIQNNLGKIETGSKIKKTKLDKEMCKILCVERNDRMHKRGLDNH